MSRHSILYPLYCEKEILREILRPVIYVYMDRGWVHSICGRNVFDFQCTFVTFGLLQLHEKRELYDLGVLWKIGFVKYFATVDL